MGFSFFQPTRQPNLLMFPLSTQEGTEIAGYELDKSLVDAIDALRRSREDDARGADIARVEPL